LPALSKGVALVTALLLSGLSSACLAQTDVPPPARGDSASLAVPDSASLALPEKNFTRAALEVTGVNVGVWLFCRYIREGGTNTGFRIGIQSWKENLLNGFEWDDNQFHTNQLAHPYHGSMYFCSARANGFDFWESIPFNFAGSAMWEYFGEKHHASINDWISTSVGGIALGEVLHRFSWMIIDQQAQGRERTWREIGGLFVNPMGSINRLITGDLSRVGPNPPGRFPEHYQAAMRYGLRYTGEEKLTNADTTRFFMRLRAMHGDLVGGECRKPFDVFSFDGQLNFGDANLLGRAQAIGLLRSWEMHRGENASWYFATTTNYDYISNNAYVYGGQSVGGSVLTRVKSDAWSMDAGLGLSWIILGATASDYESYTGRTYDYGPGTNTRLFAVLSHRGRNVAALESDLYYLRIMNGTEANHLVTETRLTAGLPLKGPLGIGAEFSVYHAERNYADFADVSERDPQLTAYFSWSY
jgi:hypothetical protein